MSADSPESTRPLPSMTSLPVWLTVAAPSGFQGKQLRPKLATLRIDVPHPIVTLTRLV